jgi:predicted SprT family Zn-dependent metalloprotease
MEDQVIAVTPTQEVYGNLQTAFDKLNAELFEGKLPHVVITLQRKKRAYGFYCRGRFDNGAGVKIDEIALNPQYGNMREPVQVLSTLAHEMVHLWQHCFGKVTPSNHHNHEWGNKMKSIGLPPAPTRPGGKTTGNSVTHTIDPDGPFAACAPAILEASGNLKGVGDALTGPAPVRKSGKYIKYECPCCGSLARSRPGMVLACGDASHEGHLHGMVEEGTEAWVALQLKKLAVARG